MPYIKTVFINKVLLVDSPVYSFSYFPCLFLVQQSQLLYHKLNDQQSLKYLMSDLLQK